MADYDGWRGWARREREAGGRGASWHGRSGGAGDLNGPAAYDGGEDWFSRPIYGPERYGLGPYHERLRRRRRPDDEVQREVTDALFYDTWVDADAITVEVREGVVTLRGTLPSYDEIRYANDDAWDVEGVLGVHSELDVRE